MFWLILITKDRIFWSDKFDLLIWSSEIRPSDPHSMFRLFWLVKNAGYTKLLKLNLFRFLQLEKGTFPRVAFCFYTRLNLLLVLLESSFASKEKINQKHFEKYFEIFLFKKVLIFIFFNCSNIFFLLYYFWREK